MLLGFRPFCWIKKVLQPSRQKLSPSCDKLLPDWAQADIVQWNVHIRVCMCVCVCADKGAKEERALQVHRVK